MASAPEPILEPDLPIIDPHHHLWLIPDEELAGFDALDDEDAAVIATMFRKHARYLFEEFLADARSGHAIVASVFMEGHRMYRRSGPAHLRSVGEVEFLNGVAAVAESGVFGDTRGLGAAIVGGIDFRFGDRSRETLEALMRAGGDRFRGVRPIGVAYDELLAKGKESLLGTPGLMLDPTFRDGFRHLGPLGLSCDIFPMEPQLPEVADLAAAFPDIRIIVSHFGSPIGVGPYKGRLAERFGIWKGNIERLARLPNVAMKLGGLGMPNTGLPSTAQAEEPSSEALARDWTPWIETCIEAFGVDRCMFESNFPIDGITASYPRIWNAFKRSVTGASRNEKLALFAGTAARIYGIDVVAWDRVPARPLSYGDRG